MSALGPQSHEKWMFKTTNNMDYNPPKIQGTKWVPVVGYISDQLPGTEMGDDRCISLYRSVAERERDEGVLWIISWPIPFRIEKNANIFFGCEVLVRPGWWPCRSGRNGSGKVLNKKKWLEDGIPWKIHGSCWRTNISPQNWWLED